MVGVTRYLDRARWPRRALSIAIVFELLVAGGLAALRAADSTEAFEPSEAVAAFQAQMTPSSSTTVIPATTAASSTTIGVEPTGPAQGTASPPSTPVVDGDATPTSTSVPADSRPRLPIEGVYVYDTVGYEQIDFAGGSRRRRDDQRHPQTLREHRER